MLVDVGCGSCCSTNNGRGVLVARVVPEVGVGAFVQHAGGTWVASGSTGVALDFLHGGRGSIDVCYGGRGIHFCSRRVLWVRNPVMVGYSSGTGRRPVVTRAIVSGNGVDVAAVGGIVDTDVDVASGWWLRRQQYVRAQREQLSFLLLNTFLEMGNVGFLVLALRVDVFVLLLFWLTAVGRW
jgi:hypothetical protein